MECTNDAHLSVLLPKQNLVLGSGEWSFHVWCAKLKIGTVRDNKGGDIYGLKARTYVWRDVTNYGGSAAEIKPPSRDICAGEQIGWQGT